MRNVHDPDPSAVLNLSAVAQVTDHAVMITGRAGRIDWVNPGFTRLTGYRCHEVVGRPAALLRGPRSDARLDERYARCLARGQGFHVETRLYAKSGAASWQALDVHALRDETGRIEGCITLAVDVTEQVTLARRLEAAKLRAERAERLKGEFLANVSHEIRTPMYGLLGMIDLALNTELSVDQRRYLGLARASCTALTRLVNDVLDLSKMEAGQLQVAHDTFDLHAFMSDLARSFAVAARSRGLRLRLLAAADLPQHVCTDRARLQQVLTNLLGNAIKFTARGDVTLDLSWHDTRLTACVRDTGCGIAADQLQRVFEPFVQLNPAATQHGTGLGLTITRRLVQTLGGKLSVVSTPARGSSFTVDLPVRWISSCTALPLEGMRVRLAETDEQLFAQYASWLRQMGGVCVSGDAGQPHDALVMLSEADEPVPRADLVPCVNLVKPLMPAELHAALSALRQRPPREIFMAAETSPPARQLTGLRALLVEDDPVNRLVSEASLRHAGMEVCTSADGHQALALFAHQPFDVVLTDLRLPCIDGLEVARAMRRIERERGTRCAIVALSASVMPQDRAGCIDAGMDDFLAKPIAKELLYESLARHVQRR